MHPDFPMVIHCVACIGAAALPCLPPPTAALPYPPLLTAQVAMALGRCSLVLGCRKESEELWKVFTQVVDK